MRSRYAIAMGVAIETLRRRGRWTQIEICKFTGNQISQSAISRWEHGQTLPDAFDLHLLTKAMADDRLSDLAARVYKDLTKLTKKRSLRELHAIAVIAAEKHIYAMIGAY